MERRAGHCSSELCQPVYNKPQPISKSTGVGFSNSWRKPLLEYWYEIRSYLGLICLKLINVSLKYE